MKEKLEKNGQFVVGSWIRVDVELDWNLIPFFFGARSTQQQSTWAILRLLLTYRQPDHCLVRADGCFVVPTIYPPWGRLRCMMRLLMLEDKQQQRQEFSEPWHNFRVYGLNNSPLLHFLCECHCWSAEHNTVAMHSDSSWAVEWPSWRRRGGHMNLISVCSA